jgi:diaminohydroxyphosphoribosylaminopyrimidine deaminase/5-amino-6-(5-phosphoribosylamino)uracil reductase
MPAPAQNDAKWMQRALTLARRGEALASPNPMVGAILVRGGRVIGEGFHTYDGLRHAEIIAIEKAADAARGSTLYVNLEPCCHQGRTGPCTRAIIAAGIKRVVAAMRDPNPSVAGKGFRRLRAAGIEVVTGLAEPEAQRLNEAFAVWIATRRPLVTTKCAMTLDSHMILPVGRKGRSLWITSEAAVTEGIRMRHAADAILTGIGTVLTDNPLLTDRTGLPRTRPLLRVVLDSRLRLPLRSQIVRTADKDVLVFTHQNASSPRARALARAGVEVVTISKNARHGLDLRAVVKELGRRKILNLMLEPGPTLHQSALDAGIVDKVRLFYGPFLAGLPPIDRSSNARAASPLRSLANLSIESLGPDFAIEGYLRDIYRPARVK